MQATALLSLILASSYVLAAPSQPEQVHEHPQPNQSEVPLGVQSPVSGQAPVAVQAPASIYQQQQAIPVDQQSHTVQHNVHQGQQQPSYYSPAGLIQVIGEQGVPVSGGQGKPQHFPAGGEQYGQPESSALPPNYKPFGNWGLYIGGNPADGYYTNYYKSLSSNVEKQADSVVPSKPVAPSAQGPLSGSVLRQAFVPSSTPYVSNDFYSFAYSPSAALFPTAPHKNDHDDTVDEYRPLYGHPSSYSPDFYSTKRVGSTYPQQVQFSPSIKEQPAKGAVQSHVVAYPVPVGSQIVGSQDSPMSPNGVHAFTRYAVKPTAVSHDQSYYYSYPASQQVVYQPVAVNRQQQVVPQASALSYPLSFYGYPLSQLHYAQEVQPSNLTAHQDAHDHHHHAHHDAHHAPHQHDHQHDAHH